MEAVSSSETMAYNQKTALRNNPEDHHLHSHRRVNPKSCTHSFLLQDCVHCVDTITVWYPSKVTGTLSIQCPSFYRPVPKGQIAMNFISGTDLIWVEVSISYSYGSWSHSLVIYRRSFNYVGCSAEWNYEMAETGDTLLVKYSCNLLTKTNLCFIFLSLDISNQHSCECVSCFITDNVYNAKTGSSKSGVKPVHHGKLGLKMREVLQAAPYTTNTLTNIWDCKLPRESPVKFKTTFSEPIYTFENCKLKTF
jgi:hypothetical protein